jgi:hypothetical protein
MSMEILKKPEMTALNEAAQEKLEQCEGYKKCILRKIDEFLRAFNMDMETKDEGLIEKIEEFNDLMEKTNAAEITKDSHLAQIIGTLAPKVAWIARRENLRKELQKTEISSDEKKEIEKKLSTCEEPIAEAKKSILRYITMCSSDNVFRGFELSSRSGFWGDRAVSVDAKDVGERPVGIAEMDAQQFVNYSWEHFKNKKVSKEEFDLAA